MIKRLQIKFVCVIMAIVTVLMTAIFALACRNTWTQLEKDSLQTLRAMSFEPMRPGNPDGEPDLGSKEPCFALRIAPNGDLLAIGSGHYDLTDEESLRQILAAAKASEQESGVLLEWNLRYCRLDIGPNDGYSFMDISTEIQAVQAMAINCLLIGIAALIVFFVAAVLLARWLVKPVEDAWNAQRQFVGDASHELKTPLTVILTNAELLQSEEYDGPAKERFAASIFAMSCQMRGLVESLLQQARVDNGTAQQPMEYVDLSALAEECVLPFEAVYFEAGRILDTQLESGIHVMGYPQQLRQVIDILLDNGQKYSAPESTVVLQLHNQGHSHCLLSIASQGERLTPQQCKDIFKRFYRVDAARSMNHSYGLGLSIAEGIVTGHHGKIWCQSKDGVNTFFVSLPVKHRKN